MPRNCIGTAGCKRLETLLHKRCSTVLHTECKLYYLSVSIRNVFQAGDIVITMTVLRSCVYGSCACSSDLGISRYLWVVARKTYQGPVPA